MIVIMVGFPFRTVPVAYRERLALSDAERDQWMQQLSQEYRCESLILSTCNRFEVYLGWSVVEGVTPPKPAEIVRWIAERKQLNTDEMLPLIEQRQDRDAIKHLGRVTASLDSLVIGEGQIAAQVKKAYEASRAAGAAGTIFHTLLPLMQKAAKRVRTETGIARGHVSISSVAVDFAKQVFDQFHDKSVLVVGAGKMARLTLTHLKNLSPQEIVVTNRSLEKAVEMAGWCAGRSVPWEQLGGSLCQADIVLSATGASSAIVTAEWFDQNVRPHRKKPLVVLDIAVPRDFDSAIHDGADVSVFNVDDLTRVREQTLAERRSHLAPAEAIIENETTAFLIDWQRRRSGPIIRDLTLEFDRIRDGVVSPLLSKWNGKLSTDEKQQLEYAFKLFQNQLLHGPIAALQDASKSGEQPTMLDAIKKLFRLKG